MGMFAESPREAAELFAAWAFPGALDGATFVIEVFVGGTISTFDVKVSRRYTATGPR
jgi:hypothetical protein